MSVVADLRAEPPALDEVRELAREHNLVPLRHTFIADCETPVSAYLKLRGDGPSFLLESAEQGQRIGRWSFLGFRPRARRSACRSATTPTPTGRSPTSWRATGSPPLEGLPPFAGGAVGLFGYDLVRSAEPTVGEPNPDEAGIPDLALMVTDVLVAFDHLRHEVTMLANVFVDGDDLEAAYGQAAAAIAEVKERLAGPVPQIGARPRASRPSSSRTSARSGFAARGRAGQGVHPRRRRLPGRAEPALDGRLPGRRLLDLPRPARDQPEPVHVLPRLRGLRDRRRVAGVAREGRRAGAWSCKPIAGTRPRTGSGPRAVRRSCWPTRRSAPST